ncbi:LamGL domain-containing protein, partial [Durusdinium trenchii]
MGGNALGNTDINLAGMDARLSDAAGNTIDYIQVGNTVSGSEDASCSSSPEDLPFDTDLLLVGGESGKYARRLPDGTGTWSMSSGASAGKDTEGDTNEGTIPGPDISIGSVTVFQGQTASFSITLSADADRDISISYQTRDSSATAGTDYSARSGAVSIPAGPLTISAWINPASFPRSGIRTIVSKDENFEFHINSSREIYWWWRTDSGGTYSFTTSGANLSENRWYHIAVVYESGRQAIYVDGVESGSASRSGNLMTNNDPLHIGQDQFFQGRYFDGRIDEVAVFSAAFDTEGIKQLYQR